MILRMEAMMLRMTVMMTMMMTEATSDNRGEFWTPSGWMQDHTLVLRRPSSPCGKVAIMLVIMLDMYDDHDYDNDHSADKILLFMLI